MSDVTFEILADAAKGGTVLSMGPGCQLETKTEDREVFQAGQPIKVEHRTGHRISGCTNPNQNTDWLWGDWS
ncbi:MAG TPA: hypothetical protein VE990_20265 [Acidimicrobiales bacterium]|nr:hypothetical protein [Acidimicrobiales bacterium]